MVPVPGDAAPVPRDTDPAARDTVPVPGDTDPARRDAVPAEPCRTAGIDTSSPKSGSLGEEPMMIAHGLAASCSQEGVKPGDCEEDEETQRDCRKLDCSAGRCQRGDEEGRDAEEGLECCALTAKERLWSKQEELGLNQHGVKFSSICCTQMTGSLKNKENQANVQVTAETLPKPAEEAQGMKADGTRMFTKAGFRNDRVSKDLPAESSECPLVDTVMSSDKVPETSTLVFSEPLIVRNVESAIEHPQEKNEYNGLKAPTVMLLATGSNVSILKTREEKLPREIPDDESNTPLAICQSYQQDEGKTVYDFRTLRLPNDEPDRASIQSSRTVSLAVSEVSCPVQKGTCYLDFRNTLGESSSAAVCRINRQGQEENLCGKMESQNHHDHETGVLENQSSKSIPAEQPSVVGNEELSRYKTDHREISNNIDNSYSSELEDTAEIQRKITMGDKAGDSIQPEAREDVISECCSSSVFSSTASSPENFSREKLKIMPSEAGKWKKDQCQLAVIDQHKDDTTGNSPLMETNNIVSPETEQTYVCFYNTSSKNTISNNHGCLELSSKLEKGSPVLQLLERESESNITSEELAGNLVEAPEANSIHSLSIGKETQLVSSLNILLSPFAQNSQVPHDNELTPCTANEVSSRDKAKHNLSGEGSIDASRATEEEVTEFVLPEDKFRPSVSLRTIDTPNLTSKASQKNTMSLLGNIDNVVTASENEQSDPWNCNYQRIKDQCTTATTSHILSERTHVGDDLPNSHLFKDEVETKPAESDSLEGEGSLGCNSKEPVSSEEHFPSAGGSAPWEDEVELSDEKVETQRSESLHKHPVLQTSVTSVENTKITTDSSQGEEMLLKNGENLTLLVDKCVREDHSQATIEDNTVDLDSLNHVGNADFSEYTCFIDELTEGKTNELKESKKAHGREDKRAFEEGFYSKTHCSQHVCCEKEKGELLVFTGNTAQKTSSKPECLVGDQENTVNVPSLPISTAIHGSLSDKTENMNLFSEMENKPSLRVKSMLENTPQQLLLEPSKETHVDLEAHTAMNLGVSLPQKEERWMSIENTQTEEFDSSSTYIFNEVSSVTKPLYVTTCVKRKGRTHRYESPSAEHGKARGLLQDAKSSRVCLQSIAGPTGDGDGELPLKDMDVTLPENNCDDCRQKFKNSCVEDKMEREVSPGKTLPIHSTLDEGIKERINQLSEMIYDCQAEDLSDTKPSSEMQYDATPMFFPCMSTQSSSCKELSPKCVVCREVCVPYNLNAQSKDNKKEIREGQDTIPIHSVWKENETFRSEKLDQIKKCQALKRKKMYTKVEAPLSDKAQEQRSSYQAKVTLQPSALSNLTLLRSSSKELVMSRDTKFEGHSKEIFAVTNSENKLRSTLQDVKRPKITTDVTSSQVLKSRGSEAENLSLNLESGIKEVLSSDSLVCAHHLHPETACDEIPGAFGTTNKLRGLPPLKKQPGRACKKVPTSEQPKSVRKGSKIRSSASKIPSETFHKQENLLLNSLYFAYKPATMETEMATRLVPMPRQRAKRSSLLNTLKFRKCTKEPALLNKLSAVANKLLAPAKSLHDVKSLPYSSEIIPVAGRYSQRRAKNLLEAFSCINRNLHSHWTDSWCTKMFSVQSLALYPVESTKIPFLGLSHRSPSSPLDTPVFPISFQIKLDSSSVTDLTGIVSQCSVHHRRVWGEAPEPPSRWTFSFLLSQSCSGTTASKEDSSLANELHSSRSLITPGAAALHPDHGRNAIAERRRSYSMLGLQTVLALSSPGCYRIWTRRRTLTSRIPTIQRLFMSQFTQGLKGVRFATSVADDLFSSLPYSLGRALSIWSQHGPSARPSEITPLHSHQCKWQPSGGIENSCALLPRLPVQRTAALQAAAHEIGYSLGPSFPLPLPKPCSLPEPSSSPLRLSSRELQVPAFDEADASVPACLRSQDDTDLKKIEPEKRPKKVSQIRIRKTVPKPDHNLTPMGLPRPKRLKKKEFSLEEIYTNKNYKSPPPTRSLETIFEEPKVKNGVLISVSQQKRKRILEFQDFTVPRKRKARSKIKAVGSFTRAKRAALQGAELDALLIQKLMDLEAFFANEAEHEAASSS
ncbi:protein PRR14L isoform X2 [Nothoprocta perdicaria]|uniref:protein PRR14L isoform X2 n=1 Tax=Nothoprocta perdicaria TaxID=30464 RepID=UPI000E1BF473|nr:protein PRR14L isoform X2 [Nothoprocta perdicaria]